MSKFYKERLKLDEQDKALDEKLIFRGRDGCLICRAVFKPIPSREDAKLCFRFEDETIIEASSMPKFIEWVNQIINEDKEE